MSWRWLCATGVYHAAANTLSLEIVQELSRTDVSAEEYLCKHQNVWGGEDWPCLGDLKSPPLQLLSTASPPLGC